MERTINNYYQSLCELISAVNSSTDPEAIPDLIAEHAAKAVGVKACSLRLYNYNKTELIHIASYGLSEAYLNKGPLSADKSVAEVLKGKTVCLADATTDERKQYRDKAAKEGIVSILSVPITVEGIIFGTLRLYTSEPYDFTADDKYFVNTVANLMGITRK